MFTLKINTDNAAFEDDATHEIKRILEEVAMDLELATNHGCSGNIRDVNGNTVGEWKYTK